MYLKRNQLNRFGLFYSANLELNYQLEIEDCDDVIYPLSVEKSCSDIVFFSTDVGCPKPGTYSYRLLEEGIQVSTGLVTIQ